MSELVVLVPHTDGLVDWDVVHIIHVLAKVQFSFCGLDDLNVLQNLYHHLGIHY